MGLSLGQCLKWVKGGGRALRWESRPCPRKPTNRLFKQSSLQCHKRKWSSLRSSVFGYSLETKRLSPCASLRCSGAPGWGRLALELPTRWRQHRYVHTSVPVGLSLQIVGQLRGDTITTTNQAICASRGRSSTWCERSVAFRAGNETKRYSSETNRCGRLRSHVSKW